MTQFTAPPPIGICFPVQLARETRDEGIYDGDTVKLRASWSDRVFSARLLDCWAPEIVLRGNARTYSLAKQSRILAAGQQARDRLVQLLTSTEDLRFAIPFSFFEGRSIFDLFTFGRVLGHVWADQLNVSEVLVAERLAFKTKEDCQAAGLC